MRVLVAGFTYVAAFPASGPSGVISMSKRLSASERLLQLWELPYDSCCGEKIRYQPTCSNDSEAYHDEGWSSHFIASYLHTHPISIYINITRRLSTVKSTLISIYSPH